MSLLSFEIRTARAPQDVAREIQRLTRPPAWREVVDDAVPFRGSVEAGRFRLREVTQVRHYVFPFLLGEITRAGTGSLVRVRVRPSWGGWIFFAVVCAILGSQGGALPLAVGVLGGLPLMAMFCQVTGRQGVERLEYALAEEVRL